MVRIPPFKFAQFFLFFFNDLVKGGISFNVSIG